MGKGKGEILIAFCQVKTKISRVARNDKKEYAPPFDNRNVEAKLKEYGRKADRYTETGKIVGQKKRLNLFLRSFPGNI
jgi:hypothetical protein